MTTTAAEEPTSNEPSNKRKQLLLGLAGLFLIISLIWFLYWVIWGRFKLFTDDAYVNGNLVQLMPQTSGTVVEIDTDDTHYVTEGQILIHLDSSNVDIALEQAKANLAQTVRQVRQYFENAKESEQSLLLRKADLVKAKEDVKRRKGLVGERAVSREEMQHYNTALEAAEASFNAASFALASSQGLVENAHLYTHPLVETAKAELKTAYLNSQRTQIVSPVTGFVAKRSVQVGQNVAPNVPMLAIVPLQETWVDANYKETSLDTIRIGQPATLYADAYPEVTYHGKVVGLSAGTGSAFSLLPPQNATGNWIKIIQRLPVRIQIDPEDLKKHPLQLGLSMRVTINIRHQKGERLSNQSKIQAVYKTTAYDEQLAKVDQLIQTILEDNSPDMYLPRAST